jgi:ribosomal protein S18 acetylase RimI-like enzyme
MMAPDNFPERSPNKSPKAIRPIDIRLAEEAEQIWYLQHAAYRIEARWAGLKDPPPLMETISELQQCGERFFGFVQGGDGEAAEDGELAGAISYKLSPSGELEICRLMVDPARLRQGIGECLLIHLLREVPHRTALVFVSEGNVPALALYRKLGFHERGHTEPLPGIRLVRLERPNIG